MRRSAHLVLLVAAFGASCTKESPAALDSDVAVAPAARKWQRAKISVVHEQGHGNYSERLRYWLKLEGKSGEHKSTLEELFPPAGIPSPLEISKAEMEVLAKTKPIVKLASDGHALVFSRDGGALYRYVALDAGDVPLYCPHLTFARDDSGDPWHAAPSTRALALAVLRTRKNHDETHHPSSNGAWASAFEHEALGAIAFACAHPDDAELRKALASAAEMKPFATSVVLDALSACSR